jgi:hypothetical protein
VPDKCPLHLNDPTSNVNIDYYNYSAKYMLEKQQLESTASILGCPSFSNSITLVLIMVLLSPYWSITIYIQTPLLRRLVFFLTVK